MLSAIPAFKKKSNAKPAETDAKIAKDLLSPISKQLNLKP
jgi:hypothetical protein